MYVLPLSSRSLAPSYLFFGIGVLVRCLSVRFPDAPVVFPALVARAVLMSVCFLVGAFVFIFVVMFLFVASASILLGALRLVGVLLLVLAVTPLAVPRSSLVSSHSPSFGSPWLLSSVVGPHPASLLLSSVPSSCSPRASVVSFCRRRLVLLLLDHDGLPRANPAPVSWRFPLLSCRLFRGAHRVHIPLAPFRRALVGYDAHPADVWALVAPPPFVLT